jgi:ribosome-associated heat shock protein Hsp15
MTELPCVRLDKWLWAVRLYKSRSLAATACAAGHVKIDGASVKSARNVRPGEVLVVQTERLRRTVKVLAALDQRVGAGLVSQYLEDLTPPAEFERARQDRIATVPVYPKGWGRPTKKNRRVLERFLA